MNAKPFAMTAWILEPRRARTASSREEPLPKPCSATLRKESVHVIDRDGMLLT